MASDGRLLSRARERLAEIREENKAEQQRRLDSVYRRIPRVREIDTALRSHMIELVGLTIKRTGDPRPEIKALEEKNLALQGERAALLKAVGLAESYTDEIFDCPKCGDTGMRGTKRCDCLKRLYNKELTKELGTLLLVGNESFERFDLSLYGGEVDPRTGISPRQCMTLVLDTCREYAAKFGPGSPNLMFQGGTGLGKTFLSACIARSVAEKGFSVAYESCIAALEAFEIQKFQRDTPEAEDAALRVSRYLSCDLMILDDLGTEMVTAFSMSALYNIINTRLINGRKTIISTNMTDEELRRKYIGQIVSRLEGDFLALPFVGRDIRILRKEQS